MNVVDAQVIEVNRVPREKFGKWFVEVTIDCWGRKGVTEVMKNTEDEALAVKVGDTIQV